MKGVIAIVVGVFLTHSMALAAEKANPLANCYTNTSLQLSYLECVTCGAQNYMQKKAAESKDKSLDVAPSERWIAMIATATRSYYEDNGVNISGNIEARERLQKAVMMQIQAYGFCTKFDGSHGKANRKEGYFDMSFSQWDKVMPHLTGDRVASAKEMDKFAEDYGFDGATFSKKAGDNLKYLLFGDEGSSDMSRDARRASFAKFEGMKLGDRRAAFQNRLDKVLNPRNGKVIIAEDDNGLRGCLQQVQNGLNGNGPAAKAFMSDEPDSYGICKAMQESCDISDDGGNFCYAPGLHIKKKPIAPAPAPRPVSTQPAPAGGGNYRPEPPPLPAPPPLPDPGMNQQ
jgi:hypothetical protein